MEAILTALMEWIGKAHYDSKEIRCAQSISDILSLQSRGLNVSVSLGGASIGSGWPSGGGSLGGGGNGGPSGGGPSADQSNVSKRNLRSSHRDEPPPKKAEITQASPKRWAKMIHAPLYLHFSPYI
jgi:hypothetical protein